MTIPELIQSAGPLLWVLTLLSVYTVYLAVMVLQRLRTFGQHHDTTRAGVHHHLIHGQLSDAQADLAGNTNPSAQIMAAGLSRAPAGTENVIAGMNAETLTQERLVTRGLSHLSTIAQIAPLLGLLGTVFGMVRSFLVFSQTAAPTPTQLATGISEALINTAGGLIVAVTAYVLRSALRQQADEILVQMDRSRELLLAWLEERAQRQAGQHPGASPLPSLLPASVTASGPSTPEENGNAA
ncbi:MotA/TolQ/ExbB proton channel family protein [Deinococcus soli (ex Cha et al. 2016)]|uniref:Biopolymer transport protein ExbB n=2 Tax=Deinococcus soli (ex Cha et al. 2016) TaxID=1309411 RepID=A0ACC6KGK6_9DEIO|nr:MotA/TolQ/ExbB proton channel family protein [Deinococcus soli (ex Cha et al. 2016)]MDR6218185.1 biopolymer transport protein ExbB [Deinococcus soli (ex Cha et al. 2016)]MDR6328925.1 biopolymer transport protein ExbB [Deinococcus soli (ex Cha et al. 2016)]MDR6751587.1 biopolymer transport protein ExbB [Deinococcus soli (ex Cha et al. 2016)]